MTGEKPDEVRSFAGAIRVGARSWLTSIRPDKRYLAKDAIAGVPGAVGSVPDGMAASVLAGVNPVHGLYASFVGPIAGGLTSSTRLMVITTTSAAALAAGSALGNVNPVERPEQLFLLTLLAGALMIAAGIFRLGRFTRFVSISVMLGFLTGVAANIVCGQIPDLMGAPATGSFALAKAVDVLTHPARIHWQSLLVGMCALVLLVLLAHTRLASFASVVALVIPTLLTVWLVGVARVEDVGTIPQGIPRPHLPELSAFSLNVVTGALAVAVIVLIQGVGVSESAPNLEGGRAEPNRDFIAQGIGNATSGLFRGQPVGGSVGQTALNLAAGARTRWASILSGVWMLAILVVFSGIVGKVAMPTLAAVLIYAAARSLRPGEIATVMRTGINSQIALVSTFLATLFLPISAAVGIGVALSLLLQLNREALDLTIVALEPQADGRLRELEAPRVLPSHAVTLLDVYGSLFYAGARTLDAHLPDPGDAREAVVVLRLRGRTALGATAFGIMERYANRLAEGGGRLYLSGVDHELLIQLRRTGRSGLHGPVRVFEATGVLGESSLAAYRDAEAWLIDPHVPDEDE